MPKKPTEHTEPAEPIAPVLTLERGRGEKSSGRGLVPDGEHDEPYNAYLDELDPRGLNNNEKHTKEVVFALASASDVRFRGFLKALGEPRFKRSRLATIAKACDISLPQFFEFWQSAQKTIALARAQSAMPDLISDLAVDAASRMVSCPRCDGLGAVPDHDNSKSEILDGTIPSKIKTCPNCKGNGEVREVGNTHARDKLLEVTGMTKKGGAAVSITQNFGGVTMESAVDSLNKITFDIDAEVTE